MREFGLLGSASAETTPPARGEERPAFLQSLRQRNRFPPALLRAEPPDALLQADDGADYQRVSCGDEPRRETETVISIFPYQSGSISSPIGSSRSIEISYFCIQTSNIEDYETWNHQMYADRRLLSGGGRLQGNPKQDGRIRRRRGGDRDCRIHELRRMPGQESRAAGKGTGETGSRHDSFRLVHPEGNADRVSLPVRQENEKHRGERFR